MSEFAAAEDDAADQAEFIVGESFAAASAAALARCFQCIIIICSAQVKN